MMMTQSYYAGDLNSFSRSSQRAPSSVAYYDRPVPYSHSYYDNHQDLRSEYAGRPGNRTLIADQHIHDQHTHGHQRRRIQVACSRCRKRKIKCSGDPNNGTGCTSCRSAGVDPAACIFNRVGSHALPTQDIDGLTTLGSNHATSPIDITSSAYDAALYQTHHRQSLPMLHTRMAYSEYDYGPSPVDEYNTYSSSMPRQSISSSHGAESFRPYASGSMTAPATSSSMYYESGTPFGFGNLQGAPYLAPPNGRLPSTAGEALSPLNMASMHSSLPSQTVQERRLPPVPYQQAYSQRATTPEVPEIRPLLSFNESRAHINGIYSRTGMPWSTENSRSDSINPLQHHTQNGSSSGEMGSAYSNTNDPAFGYQFRASTKSPAVSPTTTSSMSGSFQATDNDFKNTPLMMMPPVSTKRSGRTTNTRQSLPSLGDSQDYRRSSSSQEAAASLFSFSTGIDTEPTTSTDRQNVRQYRSNDDFKSASSEQQQRYISPRQSQPQHSASVDELRRRSSLDNQQQQQQQQRTATAHRMSVSNLNARY